MADDAQLEWARSEQRVIITHDPDYIALMAEGREHAGIAFCEFDKYGGRVGALTAAINRTVEGLTQESAANTLIFF